MREDIQRRIEAKKGKERKEQQQADEASQKNEQLMIHENEGSQESGEYKAEQGGSDTQGKEGEESSSWHYVVYARTRATWGMEFAGLDLHRHYRDTVELLSAFVEVSPFVLHQSFHLLEREWLKARGESKRKQPTNRAKRRRRGTRGRGNNDIDEELFITN